MRCYTTLWSVCAQHCNDPELCEAHFHAGLSVSKQLLKNIHAMTVSSFCSLMEIYIQRSHKKTPPEGPIVHPPTKKKDVGRNASTYHWHLTITKSRLVKSINCNVMLLQEFLPAICQISSESFVFQHDSALVHGALQAINFSPMTLPNLSNFKDSFKTDSAANL